MKQVSPGNTKVAALASVLVVLFAGTWYFWSSTIQDRVNQNAGTGQNTYNPLIDPKNFVASITNPFFTLTPGLTFSYEQITTEGTERIEILVTSEVRQILGVTVTEVRDTVRMNNVMIEDTKDWYAQDIDGNVWYFGEAVDNFENGALTDHAGSWEAGVDGAKPGIMMKAQPKVGDSYRQEYYQGEAEDMADVVALGVSVSVPAGTYENCLQTRDWSLIEPSLNENKFYCPSVAFLALEESVAGGAKTDLVKIGNQSAQP